jgi:D-sedoheptulose 7-phosphate isomerase
VSLPVAILAGGLATRLRPLTETIPKVLIEVAGRPFAEHQLEMLKSQGITRVVFCVGHLGEMVRDALGDGTRWGMSIDYAFDGPSLAGTGGALKRAIPRLGEEFFVIYGDSYLQCSFAAVERAFHTARRPALMTVFRNAGRWDASNVQYDNGTIVRYDKRHRDPAMQHIDYGLGVFAARAFDGWQTGDAFDLADVFRRLLESGNLAAFEVSERFFEIGSPEGLAETRELLATRGAAAAVTMTYTRRHLDEAIAILERLDEPGIERLVDVLAATKSRGGRLFFVGVGGSAANCSHAVNDFRKLAGFEAYAPVDNVSELTARANDEGWDTIFAAWLRGSRLTPADAVFVLSVGGGSLERNVSPNIVRAVQYAKEIGAAVVGILGRDGGYTATVADAHVIVPTVNPETVTPHSEAFQAVVWHLLVSHPRLKAAQTKWESIR